MKQKNVFVRYDVYHVGIVMMCAFCVTVLSAADQVSLDTRDDAEQVTLSSTISPEEEDFLGDDTSEIPKEPVSFMTSGGHMVERAGIFMLEKCFQVRSFIKEKGIFCKQYLYNLFKSLKA